MARISVADLPPKYQKQIMDQLVGEMRKENKTSEARQKYGNQKTNRGGVTFDSKKEAQRFDDLMALQLAGEIRDLRLQVEFTLQGAYTTVDGRRIRAIRYLADFTYYRRCGDNWEYVVEDVKSKATKTRAYTMKKKLMADRLGLDISEV